MNHDLEKSLLLFLKEVNNLWDAFEKMLYVDGVKHSSIKWLLLPPAATEPPARPATPPVMTPAVAPVPAIPSHMVSSLYLLLEKMNISKSDIIWLNPSPTPSMFLIHDNYFLLSLHIHVLV